jgi:tetratricopeptide (TPR) repeat protein
MAAEMAGERGLDLSDNIQSVEAYLGALERAETDFGAYGEESADIYIGLGNALRQNREFDKARDAFSRGMQIQRVNFGLYDLSQIPYLTSLADTAKIQNDWQAAADFLHQASVIQQHNSASNESFLIESLQERIDLHLLAYAHMGISEEGFKHLEKAYMVDSREVRAHLPDPEKQLEGFLASREKTAIINYEMAIFSLSAPVSKTSFSTMNSSMTDNAYKNLDSYYVNGRKSLVSIVEALEKYSDDPRKVVKAYTNLADWYIMFNKTNSAVINYKKAYQVALTQQNGDKLAEKMFSNPLILPRYNLPGPPSQITDSYQLMYSLTVSQYGKAFAIRLLDDNEDVPVSTLRRGREYLKSVRFRPRVSLEGPLTIQNHVISIYVR